MMPLIMPTHSCFDDSVSIIKDLVMKKPEAFPTREYLIVHAIVAPYGEDFAHAWVELTKTSEVMFCGVVEGERAVITADLKSFYDDIKVKESTKYTPLDAYMAERRTRRFGPWEKKYIRLTNDGREETKK